jgi:amino-acid N-acetyltransferase
MNNIHLRPGIESDREALYTLLATYEMEAEVDPAEFIIATWEAHLIGAVRLEWEGNTAYIRPLAVYASWHGRGIGRLLIQALQKETPELNVVDRGQVAPFYQRLGFIHLTWEQVPARYQAECQNCPDQETCHPTSMILSR